MRTTSRSTRRTSQPSLGKENVTPTSSRKARHRLSTTELTRLEDAFRQETHPSRQKKKDLASDLGMDYKTVTIWFQNKRQTSKLRGQEQHQSQDRRLAQVRADSTLRSVSSPSHNATLKLDSPEIDLCGVGDNNHDDSGPRQGDHVAHDGVNATSTTVFKIRPLLESLNAFTTWSRRRIEPMASTETASTSNVINPTTRDADLDQRPQPEPAIPVAPIDPSKDDEIAEQEQAEKVKEKPVRWKRVRTLEWACERQTRRRKLSKETDIRVESEDVQDASGSPDNTRMDSALSLLSLATSAQAGSPEDVIKGASLLLHFKHSWCGR